MWLGNGKLGIWWDYHNPHFNRLGHPRLPLDHQALEGHTKAVKMKVFFYLGMALILLLLPLALGHEEDTFALGEELIQEKVPCQNLSEDQLEIIGEYYMKQMHPGELHELMDERMGGEGSEQLQAVHISMAKNFYCGEHQAMMPLMMENVMGRARFGGMMSNWGTSQGYGMMGFTGFLLLVLGISIIILIALLIIKLLKEMRL